ncbi:MAG: hypothetical protein HC906_19280 [Bacteroidales bacterium]|nr:hypothetical protein [Bacteroidales bacterium]
MHELFSQIATVNEVNQAIEHFFYQGKINFKEKEFIEREIQSLFNDIQVYSWFSGDWKPLNEREILNKGEETNGLTEF